MCKPVVNVSVEPIKQPKYQHPPPGIPQSVCAIHHGLIASAVLAIALAGPSYWPSIALTIWMVLYADIYSAVLHCALDDKRCLPIPGIGPVAKGFQDHHDFPIASTQGKGLWVLMCDTVRIQWIVAGCAALFGRWTYNTALLVLMKLIFCAYGTQVGHYYAHANPERVPSVVKALQGLHLLLPPAHHWQHHKCPYEINFGIVNGLSASFLNYPLRELYRFEVVMTAWAFLTLFDCAIMERLLC